MTLDKCKSKWEGDYGDIPCNLYDGHGGPHESEWQRFPDGVQIQERWMPIHESQEGRKA